MLFWSSDSYKTEDSRSILKIPILINYILIMVKGLSLDEDIYV